MLVKCCYYLYINNSIKWFSKLYFSGIISGWMLLVYCKMKTDVDLKNLCKSFDERAVFRFQNYPVL